ncbi:hypothetical protein [Streptomyces sp. NBC_01233]|uniref:hypothetical protein n=1 Tax=Streptomyces sp. NBC_01233 TaxID=2903787 RepID=UPI002E14D0F9|nr:hypothetical protein OG332_34850 [Streptomyces sp. NBC_01233]
MGAGSARTFGPVFGTGISPACGLDSAGAPGSAFHWACGLGRAFVCGPALGLVTAFPRCFGPALGLGTAFGAGAAAGTASTLGAGTACATASASATAACVCGFTHGLATAFA